MSKLLLVFLLACSVGLAKPKPKTRAKSKAKASRVTDSEASISPGRRVATQKFSGLKLKGQLKKPDLSYIYKRKGLRADQVVDVPEDFNREIIDSSLSF